MPYDPSSFHDLPISNRDRYLGDIVWHDWRVKDAWVGSGYRFEDVGRPVGDQLYVFGVFTCEGANVEWLGVGTQNDMAKTEQTNWHE